MWLGLDLGTDTQRHVFKQYDHMPTLLITLGSIVNIKGEGVTYMII